MAIIAGSGDQGSTGSPGARPRSSRMTSSVRGSGRQLEAAAQAGNGVVDVLAQDDPAAVQLDLQLRSLGEAQRVADGFRQRDLPAFGDSGFHAVFLGFAVCCNRTYYRHAYSARSERQPRRRAKSFM